MLKLGTIQTLSVLKKTEHGIYLEPMDDDQGFDKVLLPANQVDDTMLTGSLVDVFLYRDSEGRPIATTTIPKLMLGQFATLTVKEVNDIGAFLDWGLAKDLFLPYKEMKHELSANDKVFVTLYTDKSNRLCATMKVYDRLSVNPKVLVGETVSGTVFDYNSKLGAFVAIDDKYLGLLPIQNPGEKYVIPSQITASVKEIREDGKVTLAIRENAYLQMDTDKEVILEKLKENNGFLPYHDKSDPEEISKYFGFGKKAFKRAIGRLYKELIITIEDNGIRMN